MAGHRDTIEQLYAAFARLDKEGMARCYADDAQFQDEVFTLNGKREVMGMWGMLVDAVQAKGRDDWKLAYGGIEAEGNAGRAHWDADYRFSATGRMVHNSIDAQFAFDDHGRIRSHRDRFDFWKWSRQALGAPGVLLGWTPMLRGKVRQQARSNLQKYLERR